MNVFTFLGERKRSIGRAALWLALLIVPTLTLTFCLHFNPSMTVSAAFPNRISDSSVSVVPISVTTYDSGLKGVPDAEVRLMVGWESKDTRIPDSISNGDHALLDTKITNADGFAELTLPPRSEILSKVGEGPENGKLWIATETKSGFSRRIEYRSFSHEPSPRAVMTLDRPLYQPGQTIMTRVLLLDRDKGTPISVTGTMTLKSPDNLLLAKRTVTASKFGIASAEFELSAHARVGNYSVVFEAPNLSVTKNIDVRPYRLPRFKVSVKGPDLPLERGAAGEFRVEANYTYGAPVANAEVVFRPTVAGIPQTEQRGKTDQDGVATFKVTIGNDASNGAFISTTARVTTETGRSEEGSASSMVAGQLLRVEVFPIGGNEFIAGSSNSGLLVLTDQRGQAIANANVDFTFGHRDGEKRESATTDADGLARFSWTPDYNSQMQYIEVVAKVGTESLRERFKPPVGRQSFNLSRSLVTVGETLEVKAESGVALLTRDGMTLASAPLKNGVAVLTIPKSSRGFSLVSLFRNGGLVETSPIWVNDESNDKIDLVAGTASYRPGEQAEVLLSVKDADAPTAFGLIGVDEALYALVERGDEPFVSDAIGVPAAARMVVDRLFAADPPSELWSARFRTQLRHTSGPTLSTYGTDVTRDVQRREMRVWTFLLLLLIVSSILWFSVVAVKATWSSVSVDAFSFRRLSLLVGVSILAGVVGFGFALVGRGDFFAGGATVWIGIVVVWVIGSAIAATSSKFGQWFAALVAVGISAGLLGFVVAELSALSRDMGQVILTVGIAVAAVALIVESVVWCFVLLRDGHQKAALGLATVAGALLLGATGGSMRMLGTSYEAKSMAGAPVQDRFVSLALEESEVEPMDISKEKNMPKKPEGAAGQAPRVRSWFPETMVFLPEIVGEKGEAVAKFEIPDSITTWRLNAYANSESGAFASGQKGLTVTQPVFLQLDLPTQLIQGDVVDVPLTVVNDTNEPISGTLASEGKGLIFNGSHTVSLAGKSRKVFRVEVRASKIGDGELTVTYVDGNGNAELQDAVRRRVLVRADGRQSSQSVSTFVKESWAPKLSATNVIPGSQSGYVRFFPSVSSFAMDGLDAMLREPSGCFEQTSSANYPNTLVLAALQKAGSKDEADAEKEARAKRLVELGYQKMLSFRNGDGGFGLYPGQRSEVLLTAYAVIQFVEMKKVTAVDETIIRSALDYLSNNQREDGGWSATKSGATSIDVAGARASSFVYLAYASEKSDNWKYAKDRAAEYIAKLLDDRALPLDTLAIATNAFALDEKKDKATKAADALLASFERRGEGGFIKTDQPLWCGIRDNSANIVVTAQTAAALLAADIHADKAAAMLNFLAKSKWYSGGWGNTQATVWSLRAFAMLDSGSADATSVTLKVGGRGVETGIFSTGSLSLNKADRVYQTFDLSSSQLQDGIEVESSQVMNFGAQLTAEFAVPWSTPTPKSAFSVSVRTDASPKYGVPTKTLVSAKSGLRAWDNVIVELPFGPSSFVDTDQFDLWKRAGRIASYEVQQGFVRLYIDRVESNTELLFEYSWVPLLRGQYRLPAAQMYPYYNREIGSEVQSPKISL